MYLCCYTVSCVRSLLAYGYENIAFQARALFPLGTVYFIKNLNQKVKREEFSLLLIFHKPILKFSGTGAAYDNPLGRGYGKVYR